MRIALLILQLLPYVLDLVKFVERQFPAGTGQQKLDFVLGVIESVWGSIAGAGASIPWEEVAGPLGKTISAFVTAMNGAGVFQHGHVPVAPPEAPAP